MASMTLPPAPPGAAEAAPAGGEPPEDSTSQFLMMGYSEWAGARAEQPGAGRKSVCQLPRRLGPPQHTLGPETGR